MRKNNIKLLIADNSSFMRIAIRKMIENANEIEVAGEASDGIEAVELAKKIRPDAVIIDAFLPKMDGFEATKEIMSNRPTPVIIISGKPKDTTDLTLKSMEVGAVDYLSKSSPFAELDIASLEEVLMKKILYWTEFPLRFMERKIVTPPTKSSPTPVLSRQTNIAPNGKVGIVLIGVSTGGPKILKELLKPMGRLSCPVIIAQHMPEAFTGTFANRLCDETGLNVVEGKKHMQLEQDQVVIAPGGTDTVVRTNPQGKLILQIKRNDNMTVHPSIDMLFKSVIDVVENPIAVILTGMGNDGTEGAIEFAKKNYPVLVQELKTCVVEGMPSSAINAGTVTEVLSLDRIGKRIAKWAHLENE